MLENTTAGAAKVKNTIADVASASGAAKAKDVISDFKDATAKAKKVSKLKFHLRILIINSTHSLVCFLSGKT